MNKTNTSALIFILILIAGGVFYFVFFNKPASNIKELASVEIREYEGQDLSSITDFRENSIKGPQKIDIDKYKLEFTGLVDNPQQLTYNQVIENNQNYKKVVRLDCVEGWSATILWEGVLVQDLFADLQIQPEAKTVIFHAADGYTTSFPLEYFEQNPGLIIAYKMNEVVLPPERGFPFQLVAESKWGYKWIKWITKIEFSDDEDYQGYWESRGYSDTGDRDKPIFD